MNLAKRVPIVQNMIKKFNLNNVEKKSIVRKIQNKFYCSHCRGRGYITCISKINNSNHIKYYPCIYCSGVGFNAYTYF